LIGQPLAILANEVLNGVKKMAVDDREEEFGACLAI